MRPAFSVVFLTTLTGAGQGLLVAIFAADVAARLRVMHEPVGYLVVAGSLVAVVLAGLGLFASFFHLGRPERAWRSAAMWRTSWLSREVIALPVFMAATAGYGYGALRGWNLTFAFGALAFAAALVLFYCTAMIYAAVKFLQEWASPFTIANFFLMGFASGFTLAAALAAFLAPGLAVAYALAAIALAFAALSVRLLSLARNARLRPKSTLQTAIGVREAKVRQVSQGFTGESFNTQEFFHGVSPAGMRRIRSAFLLLAFIAPMMILAAGTIARSFTLLALAFAVQYVGLVFERWFFLADANHPQNLYYQSKA